MKAQSQEAKQEKISTAERTKRIDKRETADNLSHATLAKIAEVRAEEAEDHISTEQAERHIRVLIGRATEGCWEVSSNIDMTQMNIANEGISRIGTLLSMTQVNINSKIHCEYDGPRYDATLDYSNAESIVEMLAIARSTLKDVQNAVLVLCAA